jgi:hypothetical protein
MIRIRVSQRRGLLLTDFHKFGELQILWIHTAGAAAEATGASRVGKVVQREQGQGDANVTHGDAGTRGAARTQLQPVTGYTRLPSAEPAPIQHPSAVNELWLERWASRPRYVRKYLQL